MNRLNHDAMAMRVARDIPGGSYLNLGIGLPERIANFLDPALEIVVHSENGILGMGPAPQESQVDRDLLNAGKKPVSLVTGGAYLHHADSFAIMRGGHLDFTVMGGMQVSSAGDLANWSLRRPGEPPAVGGAMDLVVGAKKVFILMEHVTKEGRPKIVQNCTLPLTGTAVVDRIYTDLAVIEIQADGLRVIEKLVDITDRELQNATEAPLIF